MGEDEKTSIAEDEETSVGEDEKAGKHMQMAAVDYKMDHYMGKVAQIHHKLRSAGQE